jgi:hypothetical protein
MPERTEMTLRQLPGGDVYRVAEVARRGRQIEIELLEDAPSLKGGALVEISAQENFLLGEVLARQGQRLEIALEHSVDRAKVAAIQALWGQG